MIHYWKAYTPNLRNFSRTNKTNIKLERRDLFITTSTKTTEKLLGILHAEENWPENCFISNLNSTTFNTILLQTLEENRLGIFSQ